MCPCNRAGCNLCIRECCNGGYCKCNDCCNGGWCKCNDCCNCGWCKCNDCCNCCFKWKARLFWGVIVVAIFVALAVGFYFQWMAVNAQNNKFVATTCIITNAYGVAYTWDACGIYFSPCDCRDDCSNGACVQYCSTCWAYFANGYITVNYLQNETQTVEVYESCGAGGPYKLSDINTLIAEHWQIGSTHICYYERNNPNIFELYLNDAKSWFIAMAVFGALACALTVLLVVYQIYDTVYTRMHPDEQELAPTKPVRRSRTTS